MENLKPGRELDALVAEKVMGCDDWCTCEWSIGTSPPLFKCDECKKWVSSSVPGFSTDISAAWEVMEKLRAMTCCLDIRFPTSEPIEVGFILFDEDNLQKHDKVTVYADAAPHAICLAALKAIEEDK